MQLADNQRLVMFVCVCVAWCTKQSVLLTSTDRLSAVGVFESAAFTRDRESQVVCLARVQLKGGRRRGYGALGGLVFLYLAAAKGRCVGTL